MSGEAGHCKTSDGRQRGLVRRQLVRQTLLLVPEYPLFLPIWNRWPKGGQLGNGTG